MIVLVGASQPIKALQSNYCTLMGPSARDVRLSPADAAANLKIMVKACIDHKFGLTPGGHNISRTPMPARWRRSAAHAPAGSVSGGLRGIYSQALRPCSE